MKILQLNVPDDINLPMLFKAIIDEVLKQRDQHLEVIHMSMNGDNFTTEIDDQLTMRNLTLHDSPKIEHSM